MKQLATVVTLFWLALCSPRFVAAQSWINVAPVGEQFSVQLPAKPITMPWKYSVGQFNVDGRVYLVSRGGVDYHVWSLKNPSFGNYKSTEGESYIDGCADLVWEGLLKPWRVRIPRDSQLASYLLWSASRQGGELLATDYLLFLEGKPGLVRIIVHADKIYVLLVMNAPAFSGDSAHFIETFSLGTEMPALTIVVKRFDGESSEIPPRTNAEPGTRRPQNAGGPTGPGTETEPNDPRDPNRIFSAREVTTKARIFDKPAAQFTEHARKYRVVGRVVIRAIFSKSGEVTNLRVLAGVPQGLTQSALTAAKQIKFAPATKDGQPVSTYVQLEYNFNLF